jgi:hypothetical protein
MGCSSVAEIYCALEESGHYLFGAHVSGHFTFLWVRRGGRVLRRFDGFLLSGARFMRDPQRSSPGVVGAVQGECRGAGRRGTMTDCS